MFKIQYYKPVCTFFALFMELRQNHDNRHIPLPAKLKTKKIFTRVLERSVVKKL